jgi:nucleoside-diphosphate-sugar epimerase
MYYRNNLGGSLSLIEAMRATGVDKIVFSSTCTTYGIPAASPIRESVPAAASQLIWRDQAGDPANTTLVRRALWETLGSAALLQCRRSRL